jgi:hypothetical protein
LALVGPQDQKANSVSDAEPLDGQPAPSLASYEQTIKVSLKREIATAVVSFCARTCVVQLGRGRGRKKPKQSNRDDQTHDG